MTYVEHIDPALEHQRCAELVTQLVVLNRDLPAAATALGLKKRQVRRLVESETFTRLKSGLLTRMGIIEEAWQDNALRRLRASIPSVLDGLIALTTAADKDADKLRAMENVLDRGGIERKSAAEIKHTVSLDQETVDRMALAAKEADAIDVTANELADFAYARQRPITNPLRNAESERAPARRDAPEGQDEHLLHGKGRPRLRGPDDRLPRSNGELDAEANEAQIRPGPP